MLSGVGCSNNGCTNIAIPFADLGGPLYFKLAPRLDQMIRYEDLIKELVMHVKNGVMSHTTFMEALWEVRRLEPKMDHFTKHKGREAFYMVVSRGVRTLLGWWREFHKCGDTQRILLDGASDGQRRILHDVSSLLVDP